MFYPGVNIFVIEICFYTAAENTYSRLKLNTILSDLEPIRKNMYLYQVNEQHSFNYIFKYPIILRRKNILI